MAKKRYSREFKRRVSVYADQTSAADASKQFGVARPTVSVWLRQYRADPALLGADHAARAHERVESHRTAARVAAAETTDLVASIYRQRVKDLIRQIGKGDISKEQFAEIRKIWSDMADYGLGKLSSVELSGPAGGPISTEQNHTHEMTDDLVVSIAEQLAQLGVVEP